MYLISAVYYSVVSPPGISRNNFGQTPKMHFSAFILLSKRGETMLIDVNL